MAGKAGKPGRLESDIEKYRGEANWPRVLDQAKQLSAKTPHLELLVKFVQAECKLERFLLENPPNECNTEAAGKELFDVQKELNDVLAANPKTDMKHEAIMLLGKVFYANGNYQAALDKYNDLGLENLPLSDISSRKLKIIGESFAIKGLCLEKLPPISTSRYKQAEREELIIRCFEKSGDLSLLQLQERQEKGSKAATAVAVQSTGVWNVLDSDAVGVGPLVETVIQRSPILYIRNGCHQSQELEPSTPPDVSQNILQRELNKGIGRFRELLRAVESRAIQGLRQTLARQLAEVLMRGVCENTYKPIDLAPTSTGLDATENQILKPRKYTGDSLFVPKDENEETLLLLLISESIATREVVLNRSLELIDVRLHTFHNATAVYDLLTITLVKRAQFQMLSETFERAMKFSFNEFHIWYQFALSLICSQKYTRAFLVLKECMRLEPDNPIIYMLAAKLCYEYLNLVSDGIKFSEKVITLGDSHPFLARGHLFLGIGHSLRADELRMQSERQLSQRKAIEELTISVGMDPNDYLAHFHLALQMALLRQIPEALTHVRRALQLRRDHLQSLHLLALLLSAQKRYEEAFRLMESAITEYPDNFSLLFTKCKLEAEIGAVENGLQTCRQMLQLWKNLYESSMESEERGTGLIERVTADTRSLAQLQLYDCDKDSGSVMAESVAASRLEHALSEVASSMGSSLVPKPGPHHTWLLQAQVWLLLAEMYLKIDRFESAHACIQEAGCICPMSHVVSHMRGRFYEAKGNLKEARKLYENAISINPAHIKSLHRLGIVLHLTGNNRLAEKVLRDAVSYDPTSSPVWDSLGKVLESLGDYEVATDCLTTALELEATSPILPFSVIQKLCN